MCAAVYKVVLLRHGESTWNKENRFTGWTDVDLSDKGVEEALAAAKVWTNRWKIQIIAELKFGTCLCRRWRRAATPSMLPSRVFSRERSERCGWFFRNLASRYTKAGLLLF